MQNPGQSKQVQLAIGAASRGRVEDPFGLHRFSRRGFHDHPQPLQREAAHWCRPSAPGVSRRSPPAQATMASINRFVSFGSLVAIDSTPASLAG